MMKYKELYSQWSTHSLTAKAFIKGRKKKQGNETELNKSIYADVLLTVGSLNADVTLKKCSISLNSLFPEWKENKNL